MSSLLSRSRSLRKPAGSELGQKKETDTGSGTQSNARPASASPSRLPLKGTSTARHTRAASTANSKTADDSTAPAAPRSRPISGVFGLGRSASVRQPASSSTASSSTTTTSRPPITMRKRPPAARPTSASGPSPASSRPTTSSGLPSATATSAQPRGHTRTKSSATALTTSTILRPPSQTLSSTPTTTAQPTLRQPTSTASRPLSLHARAQSSSVSSSSSSSTSTNTLPPRKRAPTTTSSAADTSTTSISSIPHSPLLPARRLPGAKPAFTTLQQHFTPAKSLAPKPLTSTFLAPPSPSKLPANVALSAETARLQTELLQLHLLHRGVGFVRREWEGSARHGLGSRFEAVVGIEREVGEEESRVVGGVNVAALSRWAAGGAGDGKGLDEKVGLLDGVLTTVWEMGERGGRYTRLVKRFERWVAGVREIVASREGLDGRGGGEVVRFITDLDASWKADCEGLARKVGECKGTIGVLSQGRETREVEEKKEGSSSLDRILDGVGQLVEDMLAEMELMVSIEREAVREEHEWVRRVNVEDEEEDRGAAPRAGAGAIWRAF